MADSSGCSIHDLPNEIFLRVIDYLDEPPPTVTRIKERPTYNVFKRPLSPLKQVSLTSRQLRQMVLPTLMKHASLYISEKIVVTSEPSQDTIDDELEIPRRGRGAAYNLDAIKKGLEFVQICAGTVQSLLVNNVVTRMLVMSLHSSRPRRDLEGDTDLQIQKLWRMILAILDPDIIILHGYRSIIAQLMTFKDCAPGTMLEDLQCLVLHHKRETDVPNDDIWLTDHGIARKTTSRWVIGQPSLLYMRRWSHILLNEGRIHNSVFVEALRDTGPQDSITNWLFPPCCRQIDTAHSHRFAHLRDSMTFLDEFTYIAINPQRQSPLFNDLDHGIYRLAFVRDLNLKVFPEINEVDPDDPDLLANMQEWIPGLEAYVSMRCILLSNLDSTEWRLARVEVDDVEAISRSEIGQNVFRPWLEERCRRYSARAHLHFAGDIRLFARRSLMLNEPSEDGNRRTLRLEV